MKSAELEDTEDQNNSYSGSKKGLLPRMFYGRKTESLQPSCLPFVPEAHTAEGQSYERHGL